MSRSLSINSVLASWMSLLLVVPVTAIMKPDDAMANSFRDNGLERNIAQAQMRDEATTNTAKPVTIKRLAPVFYLKDKSPNSDLELSNLTMGIAKKGERVTIIKQREGMLKVRFTATGEIGWVSQRVFQDL